MANILGVGNATLDIINIVDSYPHEDQEVRASSQHTNRGGNVANTLVVLSQLGNVCHWGGTLAKEPGGEMIAEDLKSNDVQMDSVYHTKHGKVPTSYVTLSRLTGSRTIVHYRDLPEYPFNQFKTIDLGTIDWVHFEGRNLDELQKMMAYVRESAPNLPVSLEVEKPRKGIESLFSLANVIMFSRDYAQSRQFHAADRFLESMHEHGYEALMSCTWGNKGAYAVDHDGKMHHCPAFEPPVVVDTLGAGDVFNAGLIDQLAKGHDIEVALTEASRLAGRKCGIYGLNDLV